MRIFFIALLFTISLSFNVFCQQSYVDPDIRSTSLQKYREIGVSHPDFLKEATIVLYKSPYPHIQWVGLYWEGPIAGALLIYDCSGKLLSIKKMGGVKSIQFFNAPPEAGPAVVVESILTGTGCYEVDFSIFSLSKGKMNQLFQHTKEKMHFEKPWKGGGRDIFEIEPSNPMDKDCERLSVEGIRKIYPPESNDQTDFQVEKLQTEFYCWNDEKHIYSRCR